MKKAMSAKTEPVDEIGPKVQQWFDWSHDEMIEELQARKNVSERL